MAQEYSLQSFIRDLEDITGAESSPAKIVAAAKPLLAKLIQRPDCVEPKFRQRGATEYGRYMLHRAPRFNVTAVVWGPGDGAKAHNHDTWGLVGVVENEIQETRFRRLDNGSKAGYAKLEAKNILKNSAGMVSCLVPPDDDIHLRLATYRERIVRYQSLALQPLDFRSFTQLIAALSYGITP